MPVKKVVFLSYSPIKTALEHLRVLGPLSHTEIQVINGIEGHKPNLDLVRSGDLVVFQRNFSSRYLAYQSVMNEAHEHGIPVVMDLDDYLIGLPPDHPDRKWSPFAFELPALLHAMMNVDAITVTTPVLKRVVDQYNKNVFVLPNYLDDSIWSFKPKSTSERESLVRIAFVGTQSHQPDVEKIAKPLRKIAEKYKQKVSFLFYGLEIPETLKDLANIQHRASVTYNYADFAIDVRSITADIAIAPLNDTMFNRCKSPIKYMEYTAMGLPCVFSRTVPYSDIIKDGVNGFLAEKPNEWIEKISKLIEDQILRKQMLVNAQSDVRANWMLHDHANLWQACYDQILDQGVQEKSDILASLTALGQTAEQIEEQLIKQTEKTASLNQVLQEAQAQNVFLKDAMLREEVRAADLLLAEKEHSSNLLKERDLFKEESERKTTWLEDLNARIAELEKLNNDLHERITREILQVTQEKQGMAESLEQLLGENQEFRESIIDLTRENQSLVDALAHSQREMQEFQQSIDGLTQENRRLLIDLENTKREVVDYVMSDSWKITKPLRRVARFFKRDRED